jgi:ABC-type glycerol-3-phosphate transport system substrate-binding protein
MNTTGIRFGIAMLLMAAAGMAHAQKLVVWMVGDDKVTRVMQPAVEAFTAKHPGVSIEVRDVPWADAMSKYSAALASRSGPDLITGGTTFGIDLGAKGALIDLSQRAPDLVQLMEKYAVPGALRSVRRPGGVMHAAPFDMHLQLQFYRTDLLAKAPSTWTEFDATVRQLRAGGARGFSQQWGNTGWLGFAPYLWQAGGAFYDAQCTKALVDSPEAVRALNYYASIYRQLKAPTDSWPDADGGLENGNYPLIQSGTWLLSSLDVSRRKITGRWAAAPLPAGPKGRNTAFVGGTVLGVTSFSPNVDLALDFMRTVYQADVTRRMADAAFALGLGWLPGGRADQLEYLPLPVAHKQVLLAQLKDTEGPPNCPGWQRLSESLTRAVQTVLLADGDAQQELSKAAEKMNRALISGR